MNAVRGHALFAGLVLLGVVVSLARLSPPAPVGRAADPIEFSAERALDHVRVLARAPRPIGSEAHEAARAYLVERLRELGLAPEVQEATFVYRLSGHDFDTPLRNVVARVPGTSSGGSNIVLASHYDSVVRSPGAADAASGVATLLETARALLAAGPMRNDVVLLFSDGEELGLLGARAFVREHPAARRTAAVLNFEARGTHGPVPMFDTGAESGPLVVALAKAAPRPVTASWLAPLARLLPNDTDLSAFREANVPGLGFALADGMEHYHGHTDTVDRLDPASVQHEGSYALSLARELANRDLTAGPASLRGPDLAYFDWLAWVVVRYPLSAARLSSLAVLAGFALILARALQLGRTTWSNLARGTAGLLAAALLACLVSAGLVLALVISEGVRAAVVPCKVLAVGSLFGAAAALLGLMPRGRGAEGPSALLSAGTVLSALLAASAAFAPSCTPPLAWPLALVVVGAAPWLLGRRPEPRANVVLRALGASAAATLVAPALFALLIAGAPVGPPLVALWAVPFLGLILYPAADAPRSVRLRSSLGLAGVAAALLAVGAVLAVQAARSLGSDPLV